MSMRDASLPSEGDIAFARGTISEHISANRTAFLESASFDPAALTLGRQVHGANVRVAGSSDRGRGQPPEFEGFPETDGLITNAPEVALGTIVADCTPILLYDPQQHAIGLLHAGWRGTVSGIARVGVERMVEMFGSHPEVIRAGIGPSIGPCCYEVGNEVIDLWRKSTAEHWERAVVEKCPRPHFDLWSANRLILEQAGIASDHIEVANRCTRCDAAHFFSHRAAMAGERARGRMIMVAQLD
ncbi:MAG: peptidoglycan editing factor PgeF [Thermomicrobiales bacterium]